MSNLKRILYALPFIAILGFFIGVGLKLFPYAAISKATFADIVDLFTGLGWPVTILISLLIFRNAIRQLLSRSTKASIFNASFEFDSMRDEVLDNKEINDEQKAKKSYQLLLAKRAAENFIDWKLTRRSPMRQENLLMRQWLINSEYAESIRDYEVFAIMVSLLIDMGFDQTILLSKDVFDKILVNRLSRKHSASPTSQPSEYMTITPYQELNNPKIPPEQPTLGPPPQQKIIPKMPPKGKS